MHLNRSFLKFACLIFILLLGYSYAEAQLVVTSGSSAQQMAKALAGPGISVSNATISGGCSTSAYGSFTGGVSVGMGIGNGILLTTGDANNAYSPFGNDDFGLSTCGGNGGDADLQIIAASPTFDACALEFDVIPVCDTLNFKYVFGSEEYTEFVATGYNDAFAFYISGPGIAGTQNIAVVPGTSIPVTINTVNNILNSGYYVDNGDGFSPLGPNEIQYDGYTVPMTATIPVQPCSTYHVKIAIADGNDCIYDSGVFLEAGSLKCASVTAVATVGNAIEGCQNGQINFCRPTPYTSPLTVNYLVAGTAQNGVDYTLITNSTTILAGQACNAINIVPANDGIPENVETIDIIYQPGPCLIFDTVTMQVIDKPIANAGPDVQLCSGDTVNIGPNPAPPIIPGLTYSWSPAVGISASTISNPDLTLNAAGINNYTLTVSFAGCNSSDVMKATVVAAPVSVPGNAVSVCSGIPASLGAAAGPNLTYSWSPATGLNNALISNPTATLTNPGPANLTSTYTLTTTDNLTGCSSTGQVTVTVKPLPIADAGSDVTFCSGGADTLRAIITAGYSYAWLPATGLNNANIPRPQVKLTTINVPTTTTYTLTVTQAGCTDSDQVHVNVNPNPIADAGLDTNICSGIPVNIGVANIAGMTYSWSPIANMSGSSLSSPTLTINNAGPGNLVNKYVVIYTNGFGCSGRDSMLLTIKPFPTSNAGKDVFFCSGGADSLGVKNLTAGNTYLWSPGTGLNDSTISHPKVSLTNPGLTTVDNVYILTTTKSGCATNDTAVVQVWPLPISDAGPTPLAFCTGDSVQIGFNPGSPSKNTYAWTPAFGLNDPIVSAPWVNGLSNPTLIPVTIPYVVITTDTNGCISIPDTAFVTIFGNPVANFSYPPTCETSNTLFNDLSNALPGDPISLWSWDFGDANVSFFQNPGNAYAMDSTYQVTLAIQSALGCRDTVVLPVTIDDLPTVYFRGTPLSGCAPLEVSFLDSSVVKNATVNKWNWNLGDSPINTSLQNPFYTYNSPGAYDVVLTVTSSKNCSSTLQKPQYIDVHPVPVASCSSDPTTASINRPEITYQNLSTGYDTCLWIFGDGERSNQCNVKHFFPDSGVFNSFLIVTNLYNCKDTTYCPVVIETDETFYIPNTFTPNGDGRNDTFGGYGLNIMNYELNIFDRWGNSIFISDSMDTPWDGRANGGIEKAQNDVYAYIIRVKFSTNYKEKVFVGRISLIR